MSYFKNKAVYIPVPDADISEDMVNTAKLSFNADINTLRKTVAGAAVPKTLFKMKIPVSSVFDGYEWFNKEDIKELMETPDWKVEDPFGG